MPGKRSRMQLALLLLALVSCATVRDGPPGLAKHNATEAVRVVEYRGVPISLEPLAKQYTAIQFEFRSGSIEDFLAMVGGFAATSPGPQFRAEMRYLLLDLFGWRSAWCHGLLKEATFVVSGIPACYSMDGVHVSTEAVVEVLRAVRRVFADRVLFVASRNEAGALAAAAPELGIRVDPRTLHDSGHVKTCRPE